jgi:hypothetical protein
MSFSVAATGLCAIDLSLAEWMEAKGGMAPAPAPSYFVFLRGGPAPAIRLCINGIHQVPLHCIACLTDLMDRWWYHLVAIVLAGFADISTPNCCHYVLERGHIYMNATNGKAVGGTTCVQSCRCARICHHSITQSLNHSSSACGASCNHAATPMLACHLPAMPSPLLSAVLACEISTGCGVG